MRQGPSGTSSHHKVEPAELKERLLGAEAQDVTGPKVRSGPWTPRACLGQDVPARGPGCPRARAALALSASSSCKTVWRAPEHPVELGPQTQVPSDSLGDGPLASLNAGDPGSPDLTEAAARARGAAPEGPGRPRGPHAPSWPAADRPSVLFPSFSILLDEEGHIKITGL